MFVIKRLFILIIILLVAYCLWPRKSSLIHFDPDRMAELQVSVWKHAKAKDRLQLIRAFYEMFESQYKIPPISSLKMAFDASQAASYFYQGSDIADQEKALFPLQVVFTTLKDHTHSAFDANALARMELQTWMLQNENARRTQLIVALSDELALLYDQSPVACLPIAKKFSIAMKMASEDKWGEAQAASKEGWLEVQKIVGKDQ